MIRAWLRHTAVVWLPLAAFVLILAVPGSVWGRM